MLFNSYVFIFLIFGTFVIYYQRCFAKYQILILIISSQIFYGYSQPYLLLLLFASATINAITSYNVHYEVNDKKRKFFAIIGVVSNLVILSFFKYNRLLDGFFPELQSQSDAFFNFLIAIPLPIGISFYTFQGISLIMDVYKPLKSKDFNIESNFFKHYRNTFFFITFFPQLVAGPIVKARDFFPQISKKSLKNIDVSLVFKSLVTGYFLKSVIADNLKDQTFWIAFPYFEFKSSLTLIVMLFGYSIQIFADFAGYSLIAIGVAAIFGYKLPTNFNFPYISSSIAEFWQRWHISLSSWLKEYLYFSLGGNRKGNVRTYINLIIVMFLGGLWHGAALSYGVWGLWHGIGLAIERLLKRSRESIHHRSIAVKAVQTIFVFVFVTFGWLLFKLSNFAEALQYLVAIKENLSLKSNLLIEMNILIYSFPIIIYHFIYVAKQNSQHFSNLMKKYDYVFYAAMMFLLIFNKGIPGDFVYFQF